MTRFALKAKKIIKNCKFLHHLLVKVSSVEIHTFWGSAQFNENTIPIGSKLWNCFLNFPFPIGLALEIKHSVEWYDQASLTKNLA